MKEQIAEILTLEVLGLLTGFGLFSYAFYLLFLKAVKPDRHRLLKDCFKDILISFLVFVALFTVYYFATHSNLELYCGIAAVLLGAHYFIRTCKVVVFEYLFLSSMRVGVPVLLVNLVTLIISIFVLAWLLTTIFGVKLAPLLATSALLSVVLGLALQDTLGNLFAGVALQFDKPYEIGDWVEVHTDKEVHEGEVHEITWRATHLIGLMEQIIVVPNRLMAQSEVSNFSAQKKPIYRGISVYLDPTADIKTVKEIFTRVLAQNQKVIQSLRTYITLRELNEKGAHWRVVYPVECYLLQYIAVDEILTAAHAEFAKAGISLARLRLDAAGYPITFVYPPHQG